MNWNPFKRIIYYSPINGKITVGNQKNEKAIFAGGVTQSGGELVIMWDTVIGNLHKQNVRVHNFLLLGVGAGMVLRIVKKYYPKASLIGIEIDPIMKKIAVEQFGWKDTPLQEIIIADAISWLNTKAPINHFDLIAVDLFIGPLNATHTRDKRFLENLKKTMKKNGILLYNAHYQEENEKDYKKFRDLTNIVFEDVEEVFTYLLNRLLLLRKP